MAEAPKFEEGLAALEKLVAELEDGELGLEEALARFEQGVKLAGRLQSGLEDTSRRLEKLSAGGLRPLSETQSDEEGGPAPAEPAPSRKSPRRKAGDDPSLF